MMRECPYSTKTRELLRNPSPPPSRFSSGNLSSLGKSKYLPRLDGARIQLQLQSKLVGRSFATTCNHLLNQIQLRNFVISHSQPNAILTHTCNIGIFKKLSLISLLQKLSLQSELVFNRQHKFLSIQRNSFKICSTLYAGNHLVKKACCQSCLCMTKNCLSF